MGWSNGQDALLAYDVNGNGRIDNITELFGDVQMGAFLKLKGWDSNGNGQIEATDTGYSKLLLWKDCNREGVSQANELSNDKQNVANDGEWMGYAKLN